MTARETILALIDADDCAGGPRFMNLRYFEHDAIWRLARLNQIIKDDLLMLLIRDAETDGAFLFQTERDAILHVLNGGNLDDVVGTDRESVVGTGDLWAGSDDLVREPLHPVLEHAVPRGRGIEVGGVEQ